MQDRSYYVHLESLTDFARELEIQLECMTKPNDFLLTLGGDPLRLGEFGEASSLAEAHRAAVAEMQGLLDQVKGAITFAQEVTHTVAEGYQQADQSVATDLHVTAGNVVGGIVAGLGNLLGGGDGKGAKG
ncbi:hypothetical protein [Amycolatopsis albispora]|uniref:WXG100 family type VII secretion target n=1 Tax=Amycolatopsis albispora TaxID=1804986 RepID=A0A344L7S7_9PSEU|nr:hypothetical protein [Amycolatopsis albispora]AXB44101.1 hypothetical protein A4R43_17520 [Amycolatopsis albispora]